MSKTAVGNLFFLLLFITGCGAGLVHKAHSSFDDGNYQKSAELYAEYLAGNPDAFLTRRKYGLALLKDNRPKEAAVQFERVVDDNPHDSRALLYLGLAYLHTGDYQKTLSAWQQYEHRGDRIIAEKVARQSEQIAAALPVISAQLVSQIEAALESAIAEQQLRRSYNASRLVGCGSG